MATCIKLYSNVDQLVSEVYKLTIDADNRRQIEHEASVKIQSWFRATKIRRYLQHLNRSAVIIQKRWRGFAGRHRFRDIVTAAVLKMRTVHYHKAATKIQKCWRGVYTRKYIFDYYSRKKYLTALQEKNERVRRELNDQALSARATSMKLEAEKADIERGQWAAQHHYLVSTAVQPSVFNSPYYKAPLPQETLLRSIKIVPAPAPPAQTGDSGHRYDPAWLGYGQEGPPATRLPPLPPCRPQGPFREPGAVREQRYRPFEPSLRVMTDFQSVQKAREAMRAEEWAQRLHDDIFYPVRLHDPPYTPLLHTRTVYGHLPYGTRHFREEQIQRHVTGERFHTIVPPVPVFSRLNQEYMEGYAGGQ